MMRYVVTGAQGFAGKFLCAQLLRNPQAVVVGIGRSPECDTSFTHRITWRDRPVPAPLPPELRTFDRARYQYMACDLSDEAYLAQLLRTSEADVVVHLAAALRDDAANVLVAANVAGTAALVRAITTLSNKPRLILGSSGSVYGVPDCLPLSEDRRCAPYEPYALSKFAAEMVARLLTAEVKIPLIIARIFNIAGPGQDERHVCGRFAAQATAIQRGETPAVLTIGDLQPTRDFIDVRDVAQAIDRLAESGVPGETYNIASGTETAIADILRLTLSAAHLEGHVQLIERYVRSADVPRAYADISKLSGLGYAASFSITRTIEDVVAYYREDVAQAVAAGATTSATS